MVGSDFDALANFAFGLAIVADGVMPVSRRLMHLLVGDSIQILKSKGSYHSSVAWALSPVPLKSLVSQA